MYAHARGRWRTSVTGLRAIAPNTVDPWPGPAAISIGEPALLADGLAENNLDSVIMRHGAYPELKTGCGKDAARPLSRGDRGRETGLSFWVQRSFHAASLAAKIFTEKKGNRRNARVLSLKFAAKKNSKRGLLRINMLI